MKLIDRFVTAKLKGSDESRQGCVISEDPFKIIGVSGTIYECEGTPTIVRNPPPKCIGCNKPLGELCERCFNIINMFR